MKILSTDSDPCQALRVPAWSPENIYQEVANEVGIGVHDVTDNQFSSNKILPGGEKCLQGSENRYLKICSLIHAACEVQLVCQRVLGDLTWRANFVQKKKYRWKIKTTGAMPLARLSWKSSGDKQGIK